MKRPPEGLGPIVALDRRAKKPLRRQLYEGYREAILDGRLRPGQRLPSTRTLAKELSVSRLPVVSAFEQLVAEGYVTSQVGAGSFVSASLPGAQIAKKSTGRAGPRKLPPSPLSGTREPWLEPSGPFRVGFPDLDAFPSALWARLVAKHARKLTRRQHMYGDPTGAPALREALAAHLGIFRSVACGAEQILVVSGSQLALTLAGRALLGAGDTVWVEEPGYGGAWDALRLAGAKLEGVPVDAEGLDVPAAETRWPHASAAYVTPSHQYPLGMIMSAGRRLALLDWARRRGAWIFEDDYDSEYRYDTPPLASLQGMDSDGRVIYIGTFSKVLFPALRVGYLVLPVDLVERFLRFRSAIDIMPAPLYQLVLAEFIAEGHFARHLRRMREVYAERRHALERALAGEALVGDRAGMHVVLPLPRGTDDRALCLRAARDGLSLLPLSTCYLDAAPQPGLVLGFGSTRVKEIPDAVARLRAAIGSSRCGGPPARPGASRRP